MNSLRKLWLSLELLLMDAIAYAEENPFEALRYFLLCLMPLVCIIALFNWRVRNSLKKKEKLRKKKDKLLRRMNGGKEPTHLEYTRAMKEALEIVMNEKIEEESGETVETKESETVIPAKKEDVTHKIVIQRRKGKAN